MDKMLKQININMFITYKIPTYYSEQKQTKI